MTTTEAIVESIDHRLRELNQEIETLTAARTALDGRENGQSDAGAPPATARRTRRKSAAGSKRERRRSFLRDGSSCCSPRTAA
jgi:hypothetical protein